MKRDITEKTFSFFCTTTCGENKCSFDSFHLFSIIQLPYFSQFSIDNRYVQANEPFKSVCQSSGTVNNTMLKTDLPQK